ncbi:hypothetical protein A5819_000776 [Enterococcus sp. 7E2_DIV0204]|uniref:DUF3324 domain-containing protein n=1 Tax=Candidatus Enterococcus lemimoniae TaxID=1834167 RepID=A0ABZ2TCP9_9ENTE|nr:MULTISPECIES: DUF916 and DUF3324 domain-containing protein [unclassified Enterococcus]OTN88324.1 hypothetical protein A5819_000776 [Enterococcus sp. 7E2_DIV0204]OTO70512.1 hypothetical protein A5866_002734 [Enterococcus sp. 12C11_DIV0727]OTP48172.1 hypothetical protein A5884_003232 [Enterococcus sp. 7D2_DIV0200]
MKKKNLLFLLVAAIIAVLLPFTVHAEDNSSGNATGFTYETIKPDNQRDTGAGYFDLRMTPAQKQTVKIKIKNLASEEIEVSVKLNSTKTNANGVVEYGPTTIKKDKSLKYDFEKIVTAPETVKVPANGEQDIDIEINMPEASFDGMIAGGIQLQKVEKEKKNDPKKTGVINKYAYVIGMILTESDKEVQPNLELNKVSADLNNFRNTFFVNFSNVEAAYLENMTTQVQIMKEDSDEVLYETKRSGMRMAPNSLINFPVSMEGDRMVAGNYRAKILVTAGDRKWNWDEKFKITDEEADKFNNQDAGLEDVQTFNWKLIAGIVGGIVGLAVIIFLVIRAISKKKQAKKKQVRKKKPRK